MYLIRMFTAAALSLALFSQPAHANPPVADLIPLEQRIDLRNKQLHHQAALLKERLRALQAVIDLPTYQQSQAAIKDLTVREHALRDEYSYLGRPSAQEEMQLDKTLMAEMKATFEALRAEQNRIGGIEAIAASQAQDNQAKRSARYRALLVQPDAVQADWVKQIRQNPDTFLSDIHLQLDLWTGRTTQLELIKPRIDHLLQQQPEWSDAYVALARYYILHSVVGSKHEDLQTAFLALDRALELKPGNTAALLYQALAHLRGEGYVMAAMRLREAQRLGDDSGLLHRLWVNIHNHREDHAAARQALQRAVAMATNDGQKGDVLQALSYQELLQGNPPAAQDWFRQAAQLQPDSAWLHGNQALYLLHLAGDVDATRAQIAAASAIYTYGNLHNISSDLYYVRWARARKHTALIELGKLLLERDQVRFAPADMMARVGYFRDSGMAADLLALLQDQGAGINQLNREGQSALHIAAAQGNLATAQMLIKAGADIELRNLQQQTPLFAAINHSKSSVAIHLLQQGSNPRNHGQYFGPALHQASYNGLDAVIALLLANGHDVNAEYQGETPLTTAIAAGQLATVELLLARGASIDFKIQGQWTVVDLARETRQPDMLALLDSHRPAGKVLTPDNRQ